MDAYVDNVMQWEFPEQGRQGDYACEPRCPVVTLAVLDALFEHLVAAYRRRDDVAIVPLALLGT